MIPFAPICYVAAGIFLGQSDALLGLTFLALGIFASANRITL